MQAPSLSINGFTIYYLSEQAITLEFGQEISEDQLQRITSFNQLLHQNPFTGFETSVPAYATLSIFFDPLQVIHSDMPGIDCFEKVFNYLLNLKQMPSHQINTFALTITIPTCYGGHFGPDLEEVAAYHNITTQEVINLHSQAIYKVYMIGFVPGFAYLGGMTHELDTPRRATPRQAIPSGSVGIAGQQTGIYPLETPGGWQIIGQTPLQLFDASRDQPSLLKAGDLVVFEPLSHNQFNSAKA